MKILELLNKGADKERSIVKPYIIAEIGVNHEGSRATAKRLVGEAKEGGAHAVKFQSYKAETLASKHSPAYWDTTKEPTESQFDLFKKHDIDFSISGIPSLSSYNFKKNDLEIQTFITQEMLKKGYLANNMVYVSIEHSEKVLKRYYNILKNIVKNLTKRELIPFDSFQRRTSGPPYFALQSVIPSKKIYTPD